MIRIVEGDILESKEDIIVHQVNCMGVMGSGLAKQIREKWPEVYEKYKLICSKRTPEQLLGSTQYIDVPGHIIVNLFGQLRYGRDKQYTDYEALELCFKGIVYTLNLNSNEKTIAIPYKIGCGLGGGDWNIVYKMIEEIFEDYNVVIYKLTK